LFFRQDYSKLENRWENGVCQQTSSSTCVPSSCATVVRMLGGSLTERELAREAGTNRRGTEIWYMMRAMHRHGYEIEARTAESLKDAPVPSILGVKIGGAGHVVVLMSKTDAGPVIGNPFSGPPRRYTWKAFEERYHPSPVCFVIRPVESEQSHLLRDRRLSYVHTGTGFVHSGMAGGSLALP
jgi:ABC-type bacteriocin/lantibiotic exporter with double-glycine peptidase domain